MIASLGRDSANSSARGRPKEHPRGTSRTGGGRQRILELSETDDFRDKRSFLPRPLTNALLSALGWRLRSASLTETGIDLFDGSSRSFFLFALSIPLLPTALHRPWSACARQQRY